MIRYTLRCDSDHAFDGWFRSAEDYDTLEKAGQVGCTRCGSTKVRKDLMAPAVQAETARPLTEAQDPTEQALAALRAEVEKNSEYVGLSFAAEARRIHDGEAPERSIYGEAKPDEARKLLEDGIPVAPLPFAPKRKTN